LNCRGWSVGPIFGVLSLKVLNELTGSAIFRNAMLVGGKTTPLKNMSSSVGMIIIPN
jgi:hypothetical protein